MGDYFIDGIDFATAMFALAGAPKPGKMQGWTFLGDCAEPAQEYVIGTCDCDDETVMCIRAARDARYRYTSRIIIPRC